MKVFDDEQDKLLDHSYDGIRELDNHMPTWWLWLFYFTIALGVGYMLYYEVFGWGPTQIEEYQQEVAAAEAKYGAPEEETPVEDFTWAVSTDEADIAAGKELFMKPSQLCFTCHGNNGEGLVGPNLTDNQWMHGCQPEDIAASIINGYPDQGMLAYGSGTRISNEQVQNLISYIASIQGTEPANAKDADMNRTQPCNEGPLAQSDF
ncbi:MAG: cbb3-type cytochrome c oxidase N-terminal domain-containing protein [Balneolaceae bacterium]|nr:cbb3-type cytochrome c oxidase N-terminal domain-containing protein [Balneolaceae bacterium]